MRLSRSGYGWQHRRSSVRAVADADADLSRASAAIDLGSRGTYRAPRVQAELVLGSGMRCGRKPVARLMRGADARICHRRKRPDWRPAPATHADSYASRVHR
ncbi:IS3 family transposase [Pseudactinotalea suaedae]|uniref:IS3 family transposase n=1 Tax=Pseudactinotalea suaedae TaxID=1524924 RepID=UPI0034507389